MEKDAETLSEALDRFLEPYHESDEGGLKHPRTAFVAGALAYCMLEYGCVPRLDGEVSMSALLNSVKKMGELRTEVVALSSTLAGLTS